MSRSAVPSCIAVLLYAAACAGANPAAAQTLTPAQMTELDGLRGGDMRKLVLADTPAPVPDIAFTGPGGGEHRLGDGKGQIRVVNFWATWCAPCREENPSLDALQRDLGGPGFAVLSIATGRNSPEAIARFNEEAGITHLETYLDPSSALARAMNIPGLPVTLILNREGEEIARLLGGADWNGPDARAILAYLTGLPTR